MARSQQNVDASVTITLNGKEAEDQIKRLQTKAEGLKSKLSEARKALNPDQAQIKKMETELKSVDKTLKTVTDQTKKYEAVLKNLDSSPLNKLRQAQQQLERDIRKLTPATEAYIQATNNYAKVTSRIRSLENEYKKLGLQIKLTTETNNGFFSGMAKWFQRNFAMLTSGIAIFAGISNRVEKFTDTAAQLDDIYSDVMKTTGLLHEEVAALDEELMKLDTRTSREALLGLARDAGKLGITGKQNVLDFVEAADKINVALGEDLGEGAIRNLGKISDVFGLTSQLGIGDALTKVGSAINAVGQASTANEAYLVNFTQRLAGVMAQAKISAADTIGFASAFDQSGMAVEMASTALQQFITKMFTDTATFAKYAKMEVSDFTDLLNNDANTAIITVLQSLHETESLSDLIAMFSDMGADGVRAVSALSSVAKNIDAVTEAQRISNEEFTKGTSLQQEFDTKNENLQAQLEKAKKELHNVSVEIGQSLAPMLLKGTNAAAALLKVFVDHGKEIRNAAIAVAAFTVALKAQTIVMGVWNGLLKVGAALTATWKSIQYLSAAAMAALRGNTERATIAMQKFNASMSASVIGVVAAAVAGLTIAITHWVKKAREAKEMQDAIGKIEQKAAERYGEEASKVDVLSKIVHDNNITLDERRRALEKLKEIVPQYHADLTKEGELINDNKESLEGYLSMLKQRILTEVFTEQIEEMQRQIMQMEDKVEEEKKKRDAALAAQNGSTVTSETVYMQDFQTGRAYTTERLNAYGVAVEKVAWAEAELSKKKEEQAKVFEKFKIKLNDLNKDMAVFAEAEEDGGGVPGAPSDNAFKDALARLEAQQEEELNTIKQSYIDKEINQAEYQEAVEDSNIAFLNKKLALAQQYGEDETKYQAAILDAEIKQMERVNAEMEKLRQADAKDAEKKGDEKLKKEQELSEEMEKLARHFKKELLSPLDEYQEEKQQIDQVYAAKKLSEEEYQKLILALRKKYAEKAIRETARTEKKGLIAQYSEQKQTLKQMLDNQMLTQEEYEKSLLQLRVEYGKKATEQISSFLDAASNLVSSLRDAELSAAEAQYQADLTAAGDNAEEKERIEQEYEEKQLEIKKKYANADMAISIAKALAEGALAIVRCFSDLGPVAGAVMAGIIGVTTAAQVATIIAQRNAIMNTSVSSSSSSSSSGTSSGTRTLSGGGMKEGGFAGSDSSDNTPMGVYHANEYIAPAWMVRQNPILFRNMEEYRTTGHRPQSFTQGMKEGGYTSATAAQASGGIDTKALNETMAKMNATMEKMMNEGVQSFMVYDQFKSFENQRERFKKITSR